MSKVADNMNQNHQFTEHNKMITTNYCNRYSHTYIINVIIE